jgi:hypothetical protein
MAAINIPSASSLARETITHCFDYVFSLRAPNSRSTRVARSLEHSNTHLVSASAAAAVSAMTAAAPAPSAFPGPRHALIEIKGLRWADANFAKIGVERIEEIVPFFGHDRRGHLQYRGLIHLQPLVPDRL